MTSDGSRDGSDVNITAGQEDDTRHEQNVIARLRVGDQGAQAEGSGGM